MNVDYEWDTAKAVQNCHLHGVRFDDAIPALEDPHRLEEIHLRFPYREERIQVIGKAYGNVLFVVTTSRGENTCRIISA